MNMEQMWPDLVKIMVSVIMGGIIGLEREYRNKPAGLRTLILISVGSTLFTIMSMKLGGTANADRIASYILVGVGFIGSGVIFRQGLKVTGLTTAATIWITAAIGITLGYGDFPLAVAVMVIVGIVLETLHRAESWISVVRSSKVYVVSFKADAETVNRLEDLFRKICPRLRRKSMKQADSILTCIYRVEGGSRKFRQLENLFLENKEVLGFES
jgi:putative Mg2+ transporter-C (MgtC) family protein